ncbi:MAG: holin-like protein [Alteromonadaceae bacterium]|jgi:holin-like protein
MKNIIYSVIAVTLCLLMGKLTTRLIGGLPASLYGMIFFTLLLHFQLLNANRIKQSIEWALQNMGVCFVPAGVGIINHFELIKSHGLTIVFIIFITTFLLMTLVGLWYQILINKSEK